MIFKIYDENIAEKEIKEKKEKKEKELSERLPEAIEPITTDPKSASERATLKLSIDPEREGSLDIGGSITSGSWEYDSSSGSWIYGHGPSSIVGTTLDDLTIRTETLHPTLEEFSKKVVREIREEAADEAACAARSRAREALEEATKKERKKYLVKKSEKEEAEDKKKLEELDVDELVAAAVVRGAQLGAARVIQAVSGVLDLKPVSKDLDDIIDALSKVVKEMNLNGKVKCAPGTGATAYWFDEDEKKRKIKAKEK